MNRNSTSYKCILCVLALLVCASYIGMGVLKSVDRVSGGDAGQSLSAHSTVSRDSTDIIRADSGAVIVSGARTAGSSGAYRHAETWLAAVLLMCVFALLGREIRMALGEFAASARSKRVRLMSYIHRKDGKKRRYSYIFVCQS